MTAALSSSVINIAPRTDNPLGRVLGYYHSAPKKTIDEQTFHMYAGYYYYVITSGNNQRFLRAKDTSDLAVKSKYSWENVIGLERMLEMTLQHNLRQSPMTVEILKQHPGQIVWREPNRELRNSEKRWLRVVQNVVHRIRQKD